MDLQKIGNNREIAIIIGNGESRRNVNLHMFDEYQTYGCNAIYEDYEPNFLISFDERIVNILIHKDMKKSQVYVPDEKFHYEKFGSGKRNNAGMLAMDLAISHNFKKLFCIGFDFLLLRSPFQLSNVYEGHDGYGPETKTNEMDCFNRIHYLSQFVDFYKNVNFVFGFPKSNYIFPKEITNKSNIELVGM